MTDKVLLQKMDALYHSYVNGKTTNIKEIILKAVELGKQYQELKIKTGINIVFNELHKKN